jgi:hypothetical protein
LLASQHRTFCCRDLEEVRIYLVVEQVVTQALYDFANAGNDDRWTALFAEIVREGRQSFDVIEVEVGQEDVPDAGLCFKRELASDRACVEEYGVV